MQKEIREIFPLVSPLLQYSSNVTSQCGEDGIIDHIMSVLKPKHRYCVEFGAWDGKTHSNCYNLVMNKGWDGLMIEAHPVKYGKLVETYRHHPNVTTLNAFVEFDGANSLDSILTNVGAPLEPGLISIDIDGIDYYVWESLARFRPELVVIEFNPTVPNDVVFVQDRSMDAVHGCSLLALVELGNKKGYELVACTEWNAFFVKAGNAARLGVENTSHFILYRPLANGRIFNCPDSTIHVVGMDRLFWSRKELSFDDFQIVSKSGRFWGDAPSKSSDAVQRIFDEALAHRTAGRLAEAAAVNAFAMAVKRFEEALAHHQAGRLAEAATTYALAIDLKPDYVEAFNNRGHVLMSMGYFDEAVGCYRRAVTFRPRESDFHCNLGGALAQLGEYAAAERSFNDALEMNSEHFRAQYNLGVILSAAGRVDEAISSYQKALTINPASIETKNALDLLTAKGESG